MKNASKTIESIAIKSRQTRSRQRYYFILTFLLCILLASCKVAEPETKRNPDAKVGTEAELKAETGTEEDGEEQASDATFVIDFEDSEHITGKEINFTQVTNIGNYINIAEPRSIKAMDKDITHAGKAAIFDIKTVTADHDNWWIAGLHFDPSWGKKEYFQYTKRITFDFYSEVEYPLVTNDYGFVIELAFKLKLEKGVTDADWIRLTVPFGIPDTKGEWMRGTIHLDELTTYMFYGLDEDIDGNEKEIDYALEWMMIGPTWDVEPEIWDSTGCGRFMIDNLSFHTTMDTEISTVPPGTGELCVVVTDIKN